MRVNGSALSLQVSCAEPSCKAEFSEAGGHLFCRSHAQCVVRYSDLLVWHPYACEICYTMMDNLRLDSDVSNPPLLSLRTQFAMIKSDIVQNNITHQSDYLVILITVPISDRCLRNRAKLTLTP